MFLTKSAEHDKLQLFIFYTSVAIQFCQPPKLLQYNNNRYGSYIKRK
jgi:hypothetical protein